MEWKKILTVTQSITYPRFRIHQCIVHAMLDGDRRVQEVSQSFRETEEDTERERQRERDRER